MSKANKVEVQKGPIHPEDKNYRTMSYPERVAERRQEIDEMRGYQRMTLHEPKTSRK